MNKGVKILIVLAAVILLEAANIGIFYFSRSYFCPCADKENDISGTSAGEKQTVGEQNLSEAIAPGQIGDISPKPGQSEAEALAEANPSALDNPVIPSDVSLPAVVFNTQGKITSIQDAGITVDGNGSNFEDQIPREIRAAFSDQTVVSEPDGKTKYTGLSGLSHLAVGDRVLLTSGQNIRGKMDFTVKYVNKQ